jgi:hypothetical protein
MLIAEGVVRDSVSAIARLIVGKKFPVDMIDTMRVGYYSRGFIYPRQHRAVKINQ